MPGERAISEYEIVRKRNARLGRGCIMPKPFEAKLRPVMSVIE